MERDHHMVHILTSPILKFCGKRNEEFERAQIRPPLHDVKLVPTSLLPLLPLLLPFLLFPPLSLPSLYSFPVSSSLLYRQSLSPE